MPARAARWGRAPASRRAAIRTSAGVRTLTTTAWARAALDGHRDGATGRPGAYVLHQRSQDRTAYPIHHFRVREHAVDWTGRTGLTDLLLTARHGSEFARQRLRLSHGR